MPHINYGGGWGSIFQPSSLLGLVLWARADTLGASPVASWTYGAGNLTGSGGTEPSWSASSSHVGNQSVLYNGSDVLSTPSTTALQVSDLTISTVIYIVSYTGGATVLSKGVTGEFDAYVSQTGQPVIGRNSSSQSFNAGVVATATKTIVTFTIASNSSAAYVNGVAQGTGTGQGTATSTSNPVQVGKRSDAGTTLNGEQPEVMLYNRALAASELLQLHRYLGSKYGIAVP